MDSFKNPGKRILHTEKSLPELVLSSIWNVNNNAVVGKNVGG